MERKALVQAIYTKKCNCLGIKLFVLCDCKTRYILDLLFTVMIGGILPSRRSSAILDL